MKYRIRKTGEIIDVISYSGLTSTERDEIDDWVDYIDSNGNEIKHAQLNLYWDLDPIQIENTIDWEARRFELAKAYSLELIKNALRTETITFNSDVVQSSVELANDMIAELKKGGAR